MRECRTSGSVRGAPSNGHPYRNPMGRCANSPAAERGSAIGPLSREDGELLSAAKRPNGILQRLHAGEPQGCGRRTERAAILNG